jgi:AAA family ATP:ADP antiporter
MNSSIGPVQKTLKKLFNVQPEESTSALLLFLYFFLITAAGYIILTAKISLLLYSLSAKKLPYAYLLTAVMIGFVVSLNQRLMQAMKREKYVMMTTLFFILNLFLFWILFQLEWKWLPLLFWFWEDVFLGTSVTQFWILVNDFYNPRQTKRLVGFLVSGGLLGGVAGSLLSSVLAPIIGTENLLLVCPVLLIMGMFVVKSVHKTAQRTKKEEKKPKEQKKTTSAGFLTSLRMIKSNRHLLLLVGIVSLGIIVATMVDFQFNTVVDQTFPDKDAKTAFLGTFFTLLLILSYLLHVFTTNLILKNFGLRTALLIAPFCILLGSLAVFFLPVALHLFWAVYLKGADKSLAHSLNQSVRELLFIPIPPEIKYKTKVFIDMFVSKFSKGIAAIVQIVFLSAFGLTYKHFSFLSLFFIIAWIVCIIFITREYVNIVKKNLSIKWQDADDFIMDNVDIDTTKLVFDTLESKNRSSVLYAMNLFDLVKRDRMSSGMKRIISNKSNEIQACSMESLFDLNGGMLFPELDDTIEKENLDEQIKEIMEQNVYQELMKIHFEKVLNDRTDRGEIQKMEAAKAIGMMPADSSLTDKLKPLLKDDSPEVLRYALESAGKLKIRKFAPLVIAQLKNPRTRRIAGKALGDYGSRITGTLRDYLNDPQEDLALRKEIPAILAKIGTQKAADALISEFSKKHIEVESEVIEALYALKSKNPDIRIRENVIIPEIIQVIKSSYAILLEMDDAMSTGKSEIAPLQNRLASGLKHIFELLTLIYPKDDITRAYQNISKGEKKAVDYSLELLDNLLKKDIRDLLFPLIDDISFEDKVKRCKKILRTVDK